MGEWRSANPTHPKNSGCGAVRWIVGAAGALWAAAAPVHALTRDEANAIALQTLAPQQEQGPVVVFALPTALPRGRAVFEAGTAKPARKGKAKQLFRVRRPTWLFWEDLDVDARFQHTSRLLVVDDRTGTVRKQRDLLWWPRIDHEDAPFVHPPGTNDPSFQIYSSVPTVAPIARRARPRAPAPLALPPDALKDDCIVTIGLTRDPDFSQDFDGMAAAASRYGIRLFPVPSPRPNVDPDGNDLVRFVRTLTGGATPCKDILIYIDGHGYARGPAGLPNEAVALVGYRAPRTNQPANLYASQLKRVLTDNPMTTFKFKIDCCYAGRYLQPALLNQPNLLVTEAACSATETAQS